MNKSLQYITIFSVKCTSNITILIIQMVIVVTFHNKLNDKMHYSEIACLWICS